MGVLASMLRKSLDNFRLWVRPIWSRSFLYGIFADRKRHQKLQEARAPHTETSTIFPKYEIPSTADDARLFSLASYNILMQKFISPSTYYYSPKFCLEWDYRLNLLKQQFSKLNCDIVCLQECDLDTVYETIIPFFEDQGYQAVVQQDKNKAPTHTTANVTLFRTSKFRLTWEEHRSRALLVGLVPVQEELKRDEFRKMLRQAEPPEQSAQGAQEPPTAVAGDVDAQRKARKAAKKAKKKKQVKTFPHETVYVCNVHLEGSPFKPAARFSQMKSLIGRLKLRLAEIWHDSLDTANVIICGDFNAGVASTTYRLLRTGSLPAGSRDHAIVANKKAFSHAMSLQSAYATHGREPPATVAIRGLITEPIDFVFFSTPGLSCEGVMNTCTEEELNRILTSFLPSPDHPSDHLPVAGLFRLKREFPRYISLKLGLE